MTTRPFCVECGKTLYESRKAAMFAIRGIQQRKQKKDRLHPYLCNVNHGWHVGHTHLKDKG
jgi:hypothetical protein